MLEPDSPLIFAASYWKSNAELILDVYKLGLIPDGARVLDPTHGKGVWWRKYRPANLTTYCRPQDGSDFRHLPEEPESFDVIAWDPPYVSTGGVKTSTLPDFNDRYGLAEYEEDRRMFSSPAELQDLMNDGMSAMFKLLAPGGTLLSKSKNYVSSGKNWFGTDKVRDHAVSLGLVKVAEFVHLSKSGGPQEKGRTRADGSLTVQMNARNNYSTLAVFVKPHSPAEVLL